MRDDIRDICKQQEWQFFAVLNRYYKRVSKRLSSLRPVYILPDEVLTEFMLVGIKQVTRNICV